MSAFVSAFVSACASVVSVHYCLLVQEGSSSICSHRGCCGLPTHPQVSEIELTKYFSKHPRARLGGWQNVMPARGLPDLFGYAPIAHVRGGMRTPTIIMAMEHDAMCPYEDMVSAVQLCGSNCLLLTEQGSYVHSKPYSR